MQDKICVESNDEYLKLIIGRDCSLLDYYKFIRNMGISDFDKIPVKYLGLYKNLMLSRGSIYLFTKNNKKFFFVLSDGECLYYFGNITECNDKTKYIVIEFTGDNYTLRVVEQKKQKGTNNLKVYSDQRANNSLFSISKEESLEFIKTLLEEISSNENIIKNLNVRYLYSKLGLCYPENYNPVISDERITLSWLKPQNSKELANERYVLFKIILNQTKEDIGHIIYDLGMGAEVRYAINPDFRNNHYATDALKLVKKLVWQLHGDNYPELYLVAINKISSKVAKNAGGIYQGKKTHYPDHDGFCNATFTSRYYKIRVKPE